jgi:hypothetical protein
MAARVCGGEVAGIPAAAKRPEEGWTMAETDELWEEFHRVVNMSSRELADWLRTCSARPEAEDVPEQAGTPTGRQVLRILGKRRGDLTDEDRQVMRKVIKQVRAGRHRGDREAVAGQTGWRHRLMSLGHDPLKPA